MKFYEVQGIVLRRKKINTRDCYLSILTREMGRIEVFAGGANAPRSPLNKGASPFVFGTFSLSGRGSFRLQHVEIIDSFYHLREDMQRFLAASLISRALFAMLPEGEANRSLYELSVNTVAIFHKYPKLIPEATLYFLYGAARATGIEPAGPECMACGQNGYVFDVGESGFLCREHAAGGHPLSEEEHRIFQQLSTLKLVDFLNEKHTDEAVRGMRKLLDAYWKAQWDLDVENLQKELDQFLQEEP